MIKKRFRLSKKEISFLMSRKKVINIDNNLSIFYRVLESEKPSFAKFGVFVAKGIYKNNVELHKIKRLVYNNVIQKIFENKLLSQKLNNLYIVFSIRKNLPNYEISEISLDNALSKIK